MAGVISAHAEWVLAQRRTNVAEAASEVEAAQKAFDEATERYAQWPDSHSAVQIQRDLLQKSQDRKQGVQQALARFESKMRDPSYQQLLAEADEAEAKAAALNFANAFQPVGERIEKTATELAGLISEVLRVVDQHVQTQNALTLKSQAVGFGELYRRMPLDIETGLARVREAIERALRAAPVPDHIIRGATGIRL